MAQPANLFDRYDTNPNVREDLMDKIWNTSPDEVPVSSALGRDTCTNTYTEWLRDTLATPNPNNAMIDGDDFSAQALVPVSRIGNYCQIFSKQPAVSRRANIVRKAGQGSSMAYAKAKLTRELKRDIEAMILSSNAAVAGNSTTASKSAAFGVEIFTNTSHGVGGSTPAHNTGAALVAPTAGTARDFTELLLKDVVQKAYTSSGEVPKMVVMSPNHKTLFSAFTGIAQSRWQVKGGEQTRIISGADIYVSNFGELQIVPHYIMVGSTNVFLLNTEYANIAYLDKFRFEEMGKTGDSEKVLLTADLCLVVTAENTMAKIADLNP